MSSPTFKLHATMKILHIITGLKNGGAEAVLCRLVAADQKMGNQHFIVSLMDRGIYADHLEQAGSTVECLFMPRGRITLNGLISLYRQIKKTNPDVVQTWMYHADLIGGITARLAGIRTIVWGIRLAPENSKNDNKKLYFIIKICAYLSRIIPKKIACCSDKAVPFHQEAGYSVDKITVIPNGYQLDKMSPNSDARAQVRNEFEITDKTIVIGMVARFDPQKDHKNLFKALTILINKKYTFICLLIGSEISADNAELIKLISDAGLQGHIRLIGPRNDIPSIMNALDIHVLSSTNEGFPNVLAEAMACGTPCVSTDVGDAALIIGATGWLVPHSNPVLLAQAVINAVDEYAGDPQKWLVRQADCRKHIVDNYDLGKMISAYRQLWSNTLESTKKTVPDRSPI